MFSRRGLLAAGGVLVCALSGCTLNTFNLNLLATGKRQQTELRGSFDVSVRATETALRDMGLFVETSKDAEKATISGRTRTQRRFTLLFERIKATATHDEMTSLEIQWENDPDDQFWLDLLQATARVQFSRSGGR